MKLQIADVADLEVQVNKYKWQNYTEEELKSLAITSSLKYFGRKDSFVKQQKYDEEKRKYYKENNIQLIEIPYWDFAKINLNYLKEKMGGLLWQD